MPKYSALLETEKEEQIPADTDHRGICKFKNKEDDVYDKIQKRIRRIIKGLAEENRRISICT